MPMVSITRLRLRSGRFFIPFVWNSVRSHRQASRSDGCLTASVRRHKGAFWTLTLWHDAAATRAFMLSGVHRTVMPKLKDWCDEASLAHWEQTGDALPSWAEAEEHLKAHGRISVVSHPSPAHAAGNTLGS